jgi:hypothetical protein
MAAASRTLRKNAIDSCNMRPLRLPFQLAADPEPLCGAQGGKGENSGEPFGALTLLAGRASEGGPASVVQGVGVSDVRHITNFFCALGRTRTCAHGSGGRCSIR